MHRRADPPSRLRAAALVAAVVTLGGCAAQPSYDELVKQATAMQEANEKKHCRLALWVNPANGTITRFAIVESSGDPDFDQRVCAQILQMKIQPPPSAETPMPIYLNVGNQQPPAGSS